MTYAETYLATLKRHAERLSDKACYVDDSEKWTYADLWSKVTASANCLREAGLRPGDHVILDASNVKEFLYIYPSAHLAGATVTPLDPNTPKVKIEALFERFKNAGQPVRYIPPQASDLPETFLSIGAIKEQVEQSQGAVSDSLDLPTPDQVADIVFTSGATGQPKGVLLTHGAQIAAVDNINRFGGATSDDIELVLMPLCHSFGLGRMRCILSAGGTLVLADGVARLKPVFKAFKNLGVTGFGLVPSAWTLLRRSTGDKLAEFADQIKYLEFGSAYMSSEVKSDIQTLLPKTDVFMHYGLTECSRAVFLSFKNDDTHLDSVGKAAPLTELAVLDEHGEPCPDGEAGEICVKGPMQMLGYWQDDDATKSGMHGDWVRTGDLGHIDEDGYLYLKGRAKELINVGGRKVSPVEVDAVVSALPCIEECACVGIADPDNITGEAIVACVIPKPGADLPDDRELLELMKSSLEFYKLPKTFIVVNDIPKTPTGKIQRLALADRVTHILSEGDA